MIKANCHSDDWKVSIDFDAADYISQCTDKELRDLHKSQWGNSQGMQADWIARYYKDTSLLNLFDYVATAGCGFDCQVDEEFVMSWLKDNRPHIYKELSEEEE